MKVVSFSLWGDKPIYNIGAIDNVKISQELYPDYHFWFYVHKESTPKNTIEELCSFKNVKIIYRNDTVRSHAWRFLSIDHPDVDIMLSRDTDSRVSLREKLAVDEWIMSGEDFHIMRDHPNHMMPIMAGMFGTRKIKEIKSWEDSINNISSYYYGNDQNFLSNYIYPIIKNKCVIHASYNKIEGNKCRDFIHKEGNSFVGEIVNV